MEYTASQIAGWLHGSVEGNPDEKVSHISKIDKGEPGTLTFLANPRYTPYVYTTEAPVILVNNDFTPTQPVRATLIRVSDAYAAFASLLAMFDTGQDAPREISPQAVIDPSAILGENVAVGACSVIGKSAVIGNNVTIWPQVFIGDRVSVGDGTILHPGVKIYRNCMIGRECTLHAGVVIGADGFGFAPQNGERFKKIPQIGNVVIEDNVEIGSNTTVDRATLGSTTIGKGVKLDNLIQVAHNVEIGENTVIAAQTGISGSTRIGRNCMVAGQVGIVGHLNIGDNVIIGAQSGIEHDIRPGAFYLGTPALEAGKTRRLYVHWRNFDQLVKKINLFEKFLQKDQHG